MEGYALGQQQTAWPRRWRQWRWLVKYAAAFEEEERTELHVMSDPPKLSKNFCELLVIGARKGRRSCEVGGLDTLKICRSGKKTQSMFRPPPLKCHILSFKTVVGWLCKFHVIEDERLMSKMEGKSNFSRLLKQFHGLTWLTLTPEIYWGPMAFLLPSQQCYSTEGRFTSVGIQDLWKGGLATGRRPRGGWTWGATGVGSGEGLPIKFWNLALEIAHFSVFWVTILLMLISCL